MQKLPDRIQDIPDDILNWALTCEVSGKLYRLTKSELKFYRDHQLPVPRRCPEQRHKDRFTLVHPEKLHERSCAQCQIGIKTTYTPDREEKVLCEKCYLEMVY